MLWETICQSKLLIKAGTIDKFVLLHQKLRSGVIDKRNILLVMVLMEIGFRSNGVGTVDYGSM